MYEGGLTKKLCIGMVRQPVEEKENSEFKSALFRLKLI